MESEVLDAKFLPEGYETGVIVLLSRASGECYVRIATKDSSGGHAYSIRNHTFPHDDTFTPAKIALGSRRGRRVCIVFDHNGREWRLTI